MKCAHLGCVLLVGGSIACSSQVEPDYRGEPLAVMNGTVTSLSNTAYGPVEAAVLWPVDRGMEEGPFLEAVRVSVGSSFPTDFRIELLEPPPTDSNDDSWPYVQQGLVAAIRPGSGPLVEDENIVGVALDVGVAYVPQPSAATHPDWRDEWQAEIEYRAQALGVPTTPGYHLYRTVVTEETEAEAYQCEAAHNLCVRYVDILVEGEETLSQDLRYEKCLKYNPDAEICTSYWGYTSEEQEEETFACGERLRAQEEAAIGLQCPAWWRHPANTQGFELPVTIVLGTDFSDFLRPHLKD
jgi:hypothetical protein